MARERTGVVDREAPAARSHARSAWSGPAGGMLAALQRSADASPAVAQLLSMQPGGVIQRKEWYEYGGPDSVPHIHCYKSGCHLKIRIGNKVKRLNLVQDGTRYESQITDAKEAAAGNAPLLAAIDTAIGNYV